MVFRERTEKLSYLQAIGRMFGTVMNLDPDKVFGPIIREYAREVFQETYDEERLRAKLKALRDAQKRIANKRAQDLRSIRRLEAFGEYYEKQYGLSIGTKKGAQAPLTSGGTSPTARRP